MYNLNLTFSLRCETSHLCYSSASQMITVNCCLEHAYFQVRQCYQRAITDKIALPPKADYILSLQHLMREAEMFLYDYTAHGLTLKK